MASPDHITLSEIGKAIQIVQDGLIWKPGSAERHLRRRINRGHLPITATLYDYESIIQTVIYQPSAEVYLYWHSTGEQRVAYVTIVGTVTDESWLVMFAFTGVLESAYIVERPQYYLSEPAFEWIGRVEDIL